MLTLLSPFVARRPRPALPFLLAALLSLLGLAAARPAAASATTYVVATTADTTGGASLSLRDAITAADGNAGSAITFDPTVFTPGTLHVITLGSALPALSASVTITGPGASVVAVDGAKAYTPFSVNSGVTASLSGLTVQNGSAPSGAPSYGSGGGVYNLGTLTLTGCTLERNSASDYGGGVSNGAQGTLTLTGCTLDGNSSQDYGGGVSNDNSGTLRLTGCTLTGNSSQNYGGGVYNGNSGTLTLTGCTLEGNSSQNFGGGVLNDQTGTLTQTGCTLTGNTGGNGGGGVYNFGTLTLTDDILYGDTSSRGGGEVVNTNATEMETHCDDADDSSATPDANGNFGADPLFVRAPGTNGTTDHGDLHLQAGSPCLSSGGGLAAGAADHDGNPDADSPSIGAYQYGFYTVNTLADATSPVPDGSLRAAITYADANGSANGGAGTVINFLPGLRGTILLASGLPALSASVTITGPGAPVVAVDGGHTSTTPGSGFQLFSFNGGVVASLSGLTIQHGNAQFSGGGVFNGGTLRLTGCTLEGNTAPYGGGGVSNGGTLTLTGCTLTGNGVQDLGGGVFNNGTLTLTGCTLEGNTAPQGDGGGVFNDQNGTLTLTDDILYADTGGEISGTATATNCDIGQAGYTGSNGNIDADPRLSALGSYGGPTQTFALLPGSPCLGAGTGQTAALTTAGVTIPTTDQRGVAVPQSGRYDVGAFESRGFTLTAVGGTPQSTTVDTAFDTNLTVTVSSSFGEPVVGGALAVTAPSTSSPSATLTPFTVGTGGAASATATANALAGSYTVTASTRADTGGAASYALTNNKATPSVAVTLTSGTNPSTFGQSVTFTATLTGAVNPGGSVTFSVDGGAAVAADAGSTTFTASGGTATYTTSALAPGSHAVTAIYSGDANNYGETSPGFPQTVNRVGTGTTLTSSLNPSNFGQSVTFTATLTGAVNPTGSVTFSLDGGTPVAASSTAFTASGGTATLTTSALAAGSHVVTAHYSGDGNNAPSTSAPLTQTVTNTTVTVTAASGVYGQSATLTASLHGVGAIALPGRTLTFLVDGAVVGTAVTDGTSVATLHVTLGTIYAPGPHAVTVSFGGDAAGAMPFHAASTGTGTLTVTPAGSFLTVPGVPVTQGATATLRARLVRTPDHAALAGATLTFSVDGMTVGPAVTDGTGQATLSYAVPGTMTLGGHRITVTYGGVPGYGGSSGQGTLSVFSGGGVKQAGR